MKLKNISKKKLIIPVIIIIIAILLIAYIIPSVFNNKNQNPDDIIKNSINNLQQTQALSFTTKSQLNVNGDSKEYGNITGEILQNNDLHIKGAILGSEIELYKINNCIYRFDNITQNWQKTTENPDVYNNALFNETDPLAQFNFKEYTNQEIIESDSKNLYCVRFSPALSEDSLSQYFTDIVYTIYCDNQFNMTKAVINGKLTNNSVTGELNIVTEFSILPEDYSIEPPIVE